MKRKRKLRRRFAVLSLFFTCCFPVWAQGAGSKEAHLPRSPADGSGGAEVILRYAYWSEEKFYIENVVNTFMSFNPGITIETIVRSSDAYEEVIFSELSAGIPFDIIGIRGVEQLNRYAAAGFLTNLSPQIENSGFDITSFGPLYMKSAINGDQYGFPYRDSCWFLIYNRDLFDMLGKPYPQQMTWEEYAALAKELTSVSDEMTIWGGFMVDWVIDFIAIQKGATYLDDDVTPLRESAEFLYRIYNIDNSHMSLKEMQSTQANWLDEFERGNIAMMINGEWFFVMISADEEAGLSSINWDIAPLPVPKGVSEGTSWGHYTYAGIPVYSEHREAAFRFMSYLCGEEGALILAESGIKPAYTNDSIRKIFIDSVGKDSVNVIFNSKVLDEQPFHSKSAEVSSVYHEETRLYLLGEQTLDESMANFVKRRAEILKN